MGQYDKMLTKKRFYICALECTNAQLFQFLIVNEEIQYVLRGDSELLVSGIIFFRNILQTILHDPLTCLKRQKSPKKPENHILDTLEDHEEFFC